MSVLVDYGRPAAKSVIRISALGAVGELLFENLAERIALERLGKSVLVGVGNGAASTIVGHNERCQRLASVEAFHAGHKPRIVIGVFRHDTVCVRHADRRVEGIVANLCDVADGVAHGNREAGLVVGNLHLASSVVNGRDITLSVAENPRRDYRSAIGVQKRDRDRFASLGV